MVASPGSARAIPGDAASRSATDPGALSRGRLRQFLAYARKAFGLGQQLASVRDRRQTSTVPTTLVMHTLFLVGLLRIRSFNALEAKLAEPEMQRALGLLRVRERKVCSVDTLGYSLKRVDLRTVRRPVVDVIRKAERNKVFREGWHGGHRCVALDGWEQFSSYNRHCDACLTREVTVGTADRKRTVTQYYHRTVVAMLVDEKLDLVLDMEDIRSADVRREAGEPNVENRHEGELTAAKRLVARLRKTYGRWLDTLLVDALYANGPFLTLADENNFGVIVVLKKDNNEPLKEALSLWQGKPPDQVAKVEYTDRTERVELWDCPQIETLSTYRPIGATSESCALWSIATQTSTSMTAEPGASVLPAKPNASVPCKSCD